MQITIELKDKEVTRMSSMRAERVGGTNEEGINGYHQQ